MSIIPQFGSGPSTDTSGTGFYTKDDYREILTLANNLHIKVVPELDFPGHTHSAIKSNLVRCDDKYAYEIGTFYKLLIVIVVSPHLRSYFKTLLNLVGK